MTVLAIILLTDGNPLAVLSIRCMRVLPAVPAQHKGRGTATYLATRARRDAKPTQFIIIVILLRATVLLSTSEVFKSTQTAKRTVWQKCRRR